MECMYWWRIGGNGVGKLWCGWIGIGISIGWLPTYLGSWTAYVNKFFFPQYPIAAAATHLPSSLSWTLIVPTMIACGSVCAAVAYHQFIYVPLRRPSIVRIGCYKCNTPVRRKDKADLDKAHLTPRQNQAPYIHHQVIPMCLYLQEALRPNTSEDSRKRHSFRLNHRNCASSCVI
jgi:hypothetical protein